LCSPFYQLLAYFKGRARELFATGYRIPE
jgi:hypothetical protein